MKQLKFFFRFYLFSIFQQYPKRYELFALPFNFFWNVNLQHFLIVRRIDLKKILENNNT